MVSVVIPVYNVEEYVYDCVLSVVKQSYSDLQIIIVNDGSTDSSEREIRRVNDSRIEYYYKTNGGLSSARNYGIEKAMGRYICFVDSDDIVDRDFVSELVMRIEDASADLSICSYYRISSNGSLVRKKVTEGVFYARYYEYYFDSIVINKYGIMAWNKLYKLDTIKANSIQFIDGKLIYAEDLLFNAEYYSKSSKIVTVNRPLYYYRERKGAITKQKKSQYDLRRLELINLCFKNDIKEYIIIPVLLETISSIEYEYFNSGESIIAITKVIKEVRERTKYYISQWSLSEAMTKTNSIKVKVAIFLYKRNLLFTLSFYYFLMNKVFSRGK